jgi:hypothetical protein
VLLLEAVASRGMAPAAERPIPENGLALLRLLETWSNAANEGMKDSFTESAICVAVVLAAFVVAVLCITKLDGVLLGWTDAMHPWKGDYVFDKPI